MIGYAFCGSFCTHSSSLAEYKKLIESGLDLQPIMSENAYSTDTKFGTAKDLRDKVDSLSKRPIIHTIRDAEPFGSVTVLDALIIAPCTGNTLAKIAHGITDTSVTMAAKAHLRCDRPLLIALATNDGASQNLSNIATLLARKSVYFVPLCQDDPRGKPHSLVADFTRLEEAFKKMKEGKQMRPLFI